MTGFGRLTLSIEVSGTFTQSVSFGTTCSFSTEPVTFIIIRFHPFISSSTVGALHPLTVRYKCYGFSQCTQRCDRLIDSHNRGHYVSAFESHYLGGPNSPVGNIHLGTITVEIIAS